MPRNAQPLVEGSKSRICLFAEAPAIKLAICERIILFIVFSLLASIDVRVSAAQSFATNAAATNASLTILTQPKDTRFKPGKNAQLFVVATGPPAVSYQWYH